MASSAHLAYSGKATVLAKGDNDVVIVSAVRTAMTKGKRGGFKDTRPEELLSGALRAVYTKVNLDPSLIEDINVGNVLPPGGGASGARMAALHAGIPVSTPIATVNRQCSSGLTAVNQIARRLPADRSTLESVRINAFISAGVESMTFGYGPTTLPDGWSEANVADDYGITRPQQDAFAAKSFQKAAAAAKAGRFRDEITPLKVKWVDPKTEEVKEITVSADDGVRDGVTAESLSKLKPAFKKNGTTHAGNASQVSDGAAAVLLARRSTARRLGLPVIGKFVAAAVAGQTGLKKEDIDFFEINEAFASQAVYSIEKLGLPYEKVNLNGGAIAIGHPLGMTGARQIATGLNIAKQTGKRIFVTSMCIGSGMGMAAVFVSEH
ncbi:acetyl-CoA acetyl transferase [Lactarius quietus]|nr:acetyl-CoA acetyl transferase [Lactarius quietus]